jgi:hypothetical protein
MNVELTTEGMKEALRDRFRVILLKHSPGEIERQLNDNGDKGYGILYLTKHFIIMTRVVNLDMPNPLAVPEGWTVPGAAGTDGNA